MKLKITWAMFVICNFVPCDIKCPPKVTWNAYVEWATLCHRNLASYLDRNHFAMVKRIILHGEYERPQRTISDQVPKRNRKVWGLRHAMDVQFDFEKEMQEVKDLKKDVRNTRFVEALGELQNATNRAEAKD